MMVGLKRLQLKHQLLHSVVPTDFPELARASRARPFEGSLDAVGVVGDLQSRLTAWAELALVDGVVRVSLELPGKTHLDQSKLAVADNLGLAFHDLDDQSAPCWTEGADAGLPRG